MSMRDAAKAAGLPEGDLAILRSLAERKAAIAEDPVNRERRDAWYALDAGVGDRPMILAQDHGVRDRRPPVGEADLACGDPWARKRELRLRQELYRFEELRADYVVEPWIQYNWRVDLGDYGVEVVMHEGDEAERLGARTWDPPIADLGRDFERLRPRRFAVDREATAAEGERLEAVFGDILPVRMRGAHYWTMGMTWTAIELIGLEQMMLAMYDNPTGLHRLMAFLRDDHLALAAWLEGEGLYTLNNENDGVGSGTLGYTRDLPRADLPAGAPPRCRDLWVLLESQETVGVGPEQYAEFVFPYERAIAERFGRVYYGCCEPLHGRWEVVRNLPGLSRVSVSPWADQELMAPALGRDFVFSRKPNPTQISTATFDEGAIRTDLRRTLEVAADCRLEIIMKDVHTLHEEPDRLARWVRIAREECARAG